MDDTCPRCGTTLTERALRDRITGLWINALQCELCGHQDERTP